MTKRYQGLPPSKAETMAFLEALIWAKHFTTCNIIFELDCKSIVDGLGSIKSTRTELSFILVKCKEVLNKLS
ncbi:hypothetical protein JHK82_056053 [Glycine max]|nr:hypothetical protein JHK87_056145 [Glycine soja]KAG5077358.1 hypothetical protein JHK82_056053 [Glycine max]